MDLLFPQCEIILNFVRKKGSGQELADDAGCGSPKVLTKAVSLVGR
jgi:hypothetical protein